MKELLKIILCVVASIVVAYVLFSTVVSHIPTDALKKLSSDPEEQPRQEISADATKVEQEEALKQQPDGVSREVIGNWLDETPFIGGRITIFEQDGKLFIEQRFKDGSHMKEEIVERRSPSGRRFEDKEENSYGEFYLIDYQGNLQLWDQEGLIATAKKIDG